MSYRARFIPIILVTVLFLSGCDRAQIAATLAEHGITDPVVVELVAHHYQRSTASPSDAALARLRACESGGNYQAVSRSGKYRGAYQFDRRTWASVKGAGSDPAAASPAEQDAAARRLYASRGRSPWPVCGKRL